jgi:superfamily II DNA or RNA helicase
MELRDYQVRTLDEIRQAIREGSRRIMVMSPTGSGKTKMAAEIVNGARGKKKRVIFEVPAISLVDQTVEMFYAEGIDEVGVIQANHIRTDWSKPIQVASVQTLMRRELPQADIVIRDEAHKLFKFDVRWMLEEAWRKVPFIGLSATPWTRGLGRIYERLVVGTTTAELIERGVLATFRVFAPSHPDLSMVRTVAGDWHEGELSVAMNKQKLVADIVETWKAKAEDRPTICFAVDRAHAKSLQERFEAAGVPSAYMDCMTPLGERTNIYRSFKRGEVRVVCNVEVIGLGVDWPEVACISYCRPTKSETRFVQNIGRGLRMSAGKDDLLILDHSDTHLRLGFVTDIHHDALHMGRDASPQPTRVRLPKECPACGYLKQYGVQVCPNCGHKTAPPPPVKEYSAGELEQFNGKRKRGKTENMTLAEKAIFLAELKGYAIGHGYKLGWAAQKYKARFDTWPGWSIKDVAPRAEISLATSQWIKSQNIAWAKSKRREEVVRHETNGSEDKTTPASCAARAELVEGTLCTEEDLENFR